MFEVNLALFNELEEGRRFRHLNTIGRHRGYAEAWDDAISIARHNPTMICRENKADGIMVSVVEDDTQLISFEHTAGRDVYFAYGREGLCAYSALVNP